MAERSQYQYTPLQGPVWREPVASRLQWLPQGQQPARGLLPNRLGDYAQPEFFAALYKPEGLQWFPADRYAGRPLPQILRGDFVQPPFDALYKAEGLQWQPADRYTARALPRALPDWSIYPIQVIVAAYDPQNLEWTPKGVAPQSPVERRILGDFAQPAFDALYKPERLEWLLQGLQPARSIPFVWQGSWVIDPSPVVTVAFDPQFFPFQATDLAVSRVLAYGIVGDYSTPPLPPGPDVIPPPADTGLGGSSARHPRRVVYEKGTKRKPKTFIDRIGEPFLDLERTPEPVPDAESAGALPTQTAPVREALAARLPSPLLAVSTPLVLRPLPEDDEDDDLLLLS